MARAFYKVGTIFKDGSGQWWKIVKYNSSGLFLDSHYIMESIDKKSTGPVPIMVDANAIHNHKVMLEVSKAEQVLYGKID